MKISFLFAWYDIWIGFFWDQKKKWLYILPIPCIGFILKFRDEPKEPTKKLIPFHVPASEIFAGDWKECVLGSFDPMTEPLNVGDKVEVVNYGHMIYHQGKTSDMSPYLIGKIGTVSVVSANGDYTVIGIPEKTAWYNRGQLKLISKK